MGDNRDWEPKESEQTFTSGSRAILYPGNALLSIELWQSAPRKHTGRHEGQMSRFVRPRKRVGRSIEKVAVSGDDR